MSNDIAAFFVLVIFLVSIGVIVVCQGVIPSVYGKYNIQACEAKCASVHAKVFTMKNDNYCICTNQKVYKRKMSELYQ